MTTFDIKIELDLDGWTDVTGYVRVRDQLRITRGRRDESGTAGASECQLAFNNRDGRFSPRNPSGPYFGVIGRNTPIRVSALIGSVRLTGNASVTTPDSAALSITGDIDVRFDGRLPSWSRAGNLVTKASSAAGQWSWWLSIDSGGHLNFDWSPDGSSFLAAESTAPFPRQCGRQAVRAALDVDNGAGGHTITFYTAPTAAGPWTQLGDPVVQAGTTSIFDGTEQVRVNVFDGTWEVYSAGILDGIGGTPVADPDFTIQAEGAGTFADAAGNTWTVPPAAAVTARRYRFHGEVAAWPQAWEPSGNDVWVPVQAAGVLRRLHQGAKPLRSPYYRAATGAALAGSLRAYWPCEDLAGATTLASGLPSGAPMTFSAGLELAADPDSFVASSALPVTGGASTAGDVPAHAATGAAQVRCLAMIPTGVPTGAVVMSAYFTGGTIYRADLAVNSTGSLNLLLYSNAAPPVLVASTGYIAFAVLDRALRYSIEFTQNGSDIDYGIVTLAPGQSSGSASGATAAGQTLGRVAAVVFGRTLDMPSTVFGHVTAQDAVTSIFDLAAVLDAYAGETAGRRIERLCAEEGVPFVSYGDLDNTVVMGPQTVTTFLDLVVECETADLGVLFEPRDSMGLAYRPRTSLYNQVASLAVGYTDLRDLEPTEDDYSTRNDVTVQRPDGSSARAELAVGALSVQAPPNGVGRYSTETEINVFDDDALSDQAAWRLHLGTVDEARYPVVGVFLHNTAFLSSLALTTSACDLDVGGLVTVSDLPGWLPPDDARLIALGFTETLSSFTWSIETNAAPASPYDVLTLDDSEYGRLDSDNTTTTEALDTTETGVDYTATDTWITTATHPTEFPFDIVIGGEVMTVTAATSSTFTVTRSVNGVVKTHLTGAEVRLANPNRLAL